MDQANGRMERQQTFSRQNLVILVLFLLLIVILFVF